MAAVSFRAVALVSLGLVAGAAPAMAQTDDLGAAFIYVGPVGDAGWTYRHDQGRQCLESETGIATAFVEAVPETSDVANVEQQFLEAGHDLIFATAFGYQPFTQQVAQQNPDKHFFGITPTVAPADNILNYYGKLWDGRYLTGLVAGAMTESNIIGFVAAQPIPTVIAGINAFALGVREVNPDAEIRVIWTLSWYDPPAEKQAAVALVEAGADVIAQHQDTPSPVQGAAEKGAWAIGSESDMTSFAPERYLTGTIWDWCPFYVQAVAMVKDGSFKPGEFYGGLDDGTVSLAPLHDAVPDDIKAMVEEKRQGLIDGSFDYWTGPLQDNDGNEVVAAGQTLSIADINGMGWLVEGVVGKIPEPVIARDPAHDDPARRSLGAQAGEAGTVGIEGLTKRFAALLANDEVSFEIPAGRVLGLVGENGAGKTTAMNVLAGLYLPDRGAVSIGGTPLRLGSPRASVAAGIGMVHQQLKLVETLTGSENLSLARDRGRLLQPRTAGADLRALMADLGFTIDLAAQVWQMPLAVRQQLEILRTLAIGARLVILDEPTSVLAPPETVRLFEIVRRIAASGRAVVLISHKLDEVLGVADDLVVMRAGRVVHRGPAALVDVGRLARLIVGDRDLGQGTRPPGPFGEAVLRVEDLAIDSDLGPAAVRGASFTVRAGELVAIVGVAGNGQTELVQAIGGVRSYRGEIVPAVHRGRRFGYVPAQHLGVGLAPGMSIRDNALLGQQRRPPFGWWLRRPNVQRRAREVAARFGVAADLASPVRWLSGGNLQRLVLGRELHGEPALIVADYPTRGLDVASAGQIRRALVARASAGAAVLISSEELEESLAIANRILVMHRGEIVAEHDPGTVDQETLGRQMTTGRH